MEWTEEEIFKGVEVDDTAENLFGGYKMWEGVCSIYLRGDLPADELVGSVDSDKMDSLWEYHGINPDWENIVITTTTRGGKTVWCVDRAYMSEMIPPEEKESDR